MKIVAISPLKKQNPQDSKLFESQLTLYDVLENLQHTSVDDLEIARSTISEIMKAFSGELLATSRAIWQVHLDRVDAEILERTLLR